MDFYLAASAVIPLLALGRVVGTAGHLDPVDEREAAERSLAILLLGNLAVLITWGVNGWAEVVCLRALETGHVPFGGSVLVWTALGMAAVPFVAAALTPSVGWLLLNVGWRFLHRGLHGDQRPR